MMRLLRTLHAWAGAALCLLIAVIALSGAVLTYKPAWLRATVAGASAPAVVEPERLAAVVRGAEAGFGVASIGSITFASDEIGLHQVYVRRGGGGYVDHTGRSVQRWGDRERFVDWLFELHRGLLADDVGDKIVGWIGIVLAVMTVTGLVLWWPARRSFAFKLAPGGGRAGWLRAHRDVGVLTAPFIVVLALTGAALDLPDVSRPLVGAVQAPAPKTAGEGAVNWAVALRNAQVAFPDARVRMAVFPAKAGAPASVRLQQAGEWHANGRTIVYLDPPTGRVLGALDAQAASTGHRLFNVFWPIHAAKVGGPLWQLVVFLSGLGLTALSLYGAESYRRKLFPTRKARAAGAGAEKLA